MMLIRHKLSYLDGWQLLFTRVTLFHVFACSVEPVPPLRIYFAQLPMGLFLIYRVLLRVLLLISCRASAMLASGYPWRAIFILLSARAPGIATCGGEKRKTVEKTEEKKEMGNERKEEENLNTKGWVFLSLFFFCYEAGLAPYILSSDG